MLAQSLASAPTAPAHNIMPVPLSGARYHSFPKMLLIARRCVEKVHTIAHGLLLIPRKQKTACSLNLAQKPKFPTARAV